MTIFRSRRRPLALALALVAVRLFATAFHVPPNGATLEANDNWVDSPNKQAIIDSTIPPTNNQESAIVRTLAPAQYTAIVRGVNDSTGIAVVEVYALN